MHVHSPECFAIHIKEHIYNPPSKIDLLKHDASLRYSHLGDAIPVTASILVTLTLTLFHHITKVLESLVGSFNGHGQPLHLLLKSCGVLVTYVPDGRSMGICLFAFPSLLVLL